MKKVQSKGEINTKASDAKGPQKKETDRQDIKCKQVAATEQRAVSVTCCSLACSLLPLHATPFSAAHFVPNAECP